MRPLSGLSRVQQTLHCFAPRRVKRQPLPVASSCDRGRRRAPACRRGSPRRGSRGPRRRSRGNSPSPRHTCRRCLPRRRDRPGRGSSLPRSPTDRRPARSSPRTATPPRSRVIVSSFVLLRCSGHEQLPNDYFARNLAATRGSESDLQRRTLLRLGRRQDLRYRRGAGREGRFLTAVDRLPELQRRDHLVIAGTRQPIA